MTSWLFDKTNYGSAWNNGVVEMAPVSSSEDNVLLSKIVLNIRPKDNF